MRAAEDRRHDAGQHFADRLTQHDARVFFAREKGYLATTAFGNVE
jgi:hypothetical protein